MGEMFTVLFRTLFFYFFSMLMFRLMGKREVGELSVFDIVIYLVMSELLALAVTEINESIFKALIPIITLVLLQILLSYLLLKIKPLRDLIDGKPVVLIYDGILNQKEMKKQRYNIDDLFLQIREHDVDSFKNIAYAILETNGKLSIITYEECSSKFPFPIIQDGKVNFNYLKMINKNEEWLKKELIKRNIKAYKDVFLLFLDKTGLVFVLKESNDKK